MNDDEIQQQAALKLAKECDLVRWDFDSLSFELCGSVENLEAFYRAAFNAGLEAAAKHIESDTHNYAACIRTLKVKK